MSQISETAPEANDVIQTDAGPAAGTLVLAHALSCSEQGSEESDASTDADSAAVDEPGGRRGLLSRMGGERGAATAEYAVATMATVGPQRHIFISSAPHSGDSGEAAHPAIVGPDRVIWGAAYVEN